MSSSQWTLAVYVKSSFSSSSSSGLTAETLPLSSPTVWLLATGLQQPHRQPVSRFYARCPSWHIPPSLSMLGTAHCGAWLRQTKTKVMKKLTCHLLSYSNIFNTTESIKVKHSNLTIVYWETLTAISLSLSQQSCDMLIFSFSLKL